MIGRNTFYYLLIVSTAVPSLAQEAPSRTPGEEEIASALQVGRLVQAEKMLVMARTSGAWSKRYQLLQADLDFAQGKFKESYSSYAELFKETGEHGPALGAGLSALQLNKLDAAEPYLRKAVDGPGDQWRAWNGLGVLLDRQGKLEAGEAAFRRGLELQPENQTLWNNLGYCLLLQGKADALSALERAQGHVRLGKLVSGNIVIAQAMNGVYPERGLAEPSAAWAARLNNAGYGAWLSGRHEDARSLFARAVLERETYFKLAEQNLNAIEELTKTKSATP